MLTVIFRKSYDTSEIPNDWKVGNVTPVIKKGLKCNPGNYRPISHTCVAFKLMEDIITSSIMHHVKDHHTLYTQALQHGFRDKRSYETQLLGFVLDLVNNTHDGRKMDILLIDVCRASDKACLWQPIPKRLGG